jgi:hypothetical protein
MGGGLLRVEALDGRSTSIVRVGRPALGTLWRYTSAGRHSEQFAYSNGAVDVVETPADGFPVLVAINGMTGSATSRLPLPRSSYLDLHSTCNAEPTGARVDRPQQGQIYGFSRG